MQSHTQVSINQYYGQAPVDSGTAELIAQARNNPKSSVNRVFTGRGVAILRETITSTPFETTVQIPIGQIMLQYETAALTAQQQLAGDLRVIELFNGSVRESNERVIAVLGDVTGQRLDADQQAWAAWWTDQQGYVYKPPQEEPKPTFVEDVPLAFTPQPVALVPRLSQVGATTTERAVVGMTRASCFRAGTLVQTLLGPRAIESVAVGDQVIVEDPANGAVRYEPVLAVFRNPPARLYRVELGGDTVWATGIHRFWKAGQGWTMARDLKSGDLLRMLGGTARVENVQEGPVERVFNLEVAQGQSFFVGKGGALVHDNSLVRPVGVPFDTALADATSERTH